MCYMIDQGNLFLTCVQFKVSPESLVMIDGPQIPNQSETTALIGWFQSGDQTDLRVTIS